MGEIAGESSIFVTVGIKVFAKFVLMLKPVLHVLTTVQWKFLLSMLK